MIPIDRTRAAVVALFVAPCAFSTASLAQDGDTRIEFGGGVSVLRFNYREFKDARRTIPDREYGNLPGFSLRSRIQTSTWAWEFVGRFHDGDVAYDGTTNYGATFNSTTHESIVDIAGRGGPWLGSDESVQPYVGLGYRLWKRDIAGAESVSGLYEEYRWNYLWLGAKSPALQLGNGRLAVDSCLLRPLWPTVDVYAYSSGARYHLRPAEKTGFRLSFPFEMPLSNRRTLTLSTYIENWELGDSPFVNGTHELESSTRNAGLELRLNWGR